MTHFSAIPRKHGKQRLLLAAVGALTASLLSISSAIAATNEPGVNLVLLDEDVAVASIKNFPNDATVDIKATVVGGSGTASVTTSSTGRALVGFELPTAFAGVLTVSATSGTVSKSNTITIGSVAPTPVPTTAPATATTVAPPLGPVTPAGDFRAISETNGDLSLGAGVFTMNDFNQYCCGAQLVNRNLRGAGIDKTYLEITPSTSTKAGIVPTADWTTNPVYVLTLSEGSPKAGGFTLRATEQGHMYNGFQVYNTTNAQISDVKAVAFAGNSNFPPGEITALGNWSTDTTTWTNIEVDGAGVGATGFSNDSSTRTVVNNGYFHSQKINAGATNFESSDFTYNDTTFSNNVVGINIEENTGFANLNRPKFSGNREVDVSIFAKASSVKLTITDPILDPGQKLKIRCMMAQQKSDIRVLVGGVDKTAELVQWSS